MNESRLQKILFVDDERQILNSLERILMDYDYDLFTAESGEEALNILEEEPDIDLIISDMRMPYMDGYELLCRVKEKYPQIIRVMLSGYTDEHIIYKALQENVAKLYLLKPWDTSYLLKEIEHIFETETILNSPKISAIVNNAQTLVRLDSNYREILDLIENEADMDTIIEAISKDASTSANVLRIANSAFFDAQTGSIKNAFMKIGTQSIYTFLKSASVIDSLKKDNPKSIILDKLLEYSFLTNKLCVLIYEKCMGKSMPVNYSSAGLLHNVGLSIIADNYTEKYMDILRVDKKPELTLLEREEEFISSTHQKIGAYLLDGWDFPYSIVETALYHHEPLNEHIVNTELISVVHISQHYAFKILNFDRFPVNISKYKKLMVFYPETFDLIGVSQSKFESFFNKCNFEEI